MPVERGLGPLMAEFDFESSDVADALTHADQNVSPNGKKTTVQQRIAEVRGTDRTPPTHGPALTREPYLLEVAARAESRLAKLNRK